MQNQIKSALHSRLRCRILIFYMKKIFLICKMQTKIKKIKLFALGAGIGIFLTAAAYFCINIYLYMHFNYGYPLIPRGSEGPVLMLFFMPLFILAFFSGCLFAVMRKFSAAKKILKEKIFYHGFGLGCCFVAIVLYIWILRG